MGCGAEYFLWLLALSLYLAQAFKCSSSSSRLIDIHRSAIADRLLTQLLSVETAGPVAALARTANRSIRRFAEIAAKSIV